MSPRDFLNFLKGFFESFRTRSLEYVEFELRELENAFTLLLLSSLIGLPSPPTPIVVRILPHMVRELYVMHMRATDDDVLGEIAGLFEI